MSKKHNILYIVTDEMRADCIGACNNKQIKTPFLDKLANEAIVYDNAQCCFPVCTPSRYTMITGLYTHQHRCIDNRAGIPNDLATLPKLLKEHGYKSQAIGKLHCNPPKQDLGFDTVLLAEQCGEGRYEDEYHDMLYKENLYNEVDIVDQCLEFRANATDEYYASFGVLENNLPKDKDSTTWIGKTALCEMDKWANEPNFMMVSFVKPHHPFDAPKEWCDMYDENEIEILPGFTQTLPAHDRACNKGYFDNETLTEQSVKKITANYYASITQIDYWVGQLVKKLKQKNMYNDTIIVFTSDHGEFLGFHHMILKSNHMYEPIMRVPLIVKPSGAQSPQKRVDIPCGHTNLFTSLLKYCNIEKPYTAMDKPLDELKDGDFAFAMDYKNGKPVYSVKSKTEKLIVSQDGGMYFDLVQDPTEMNNLYNNECVKEKQATMRSALSNHLMFTSATVPYYNNEKTYTVNQVKEIQDKKDYFRSKMKNNKYLK